MTWLLRTICLVLMAAWLGGFTFYSAVVVPILHDEFGSLMGSAVTRRATDVLNLMGAATLSLWWVEGLRRAPGPADVRWRAFRLLALAASTLALAALAWLHEVMDHRLDSVGLDGFYPLHRAYLIVSTLQWIAGVSILGASVRLWSGPRGNESGLRRGHDRRLASPRDAAEVT